MRGAGMAGVLALLALFAGPAWGQTVSGTVFEDLDGDGVHDAGEPALEGVAVRLYGQRDAGGTFDTTVTTGADGVFTFSPGDGCYLVQIIDPPDRRRTPGRSDERAQGTPGYTHPVGVRRFGGAPELLDQLVAGALRYTSMGDSIAWNWNSCFDTSSFWYSKQVRDRLRCVSPSGQVDLDEAAIKGEDTDDLLVDEQGEMNNVFRVIEAQSNLVTISMVGNDLLDDEPASDPPTQAETNRFAAELVDSRQNLQEALSSLISEIPGSTVELNTLYDNLADDCASSQPHREWLPVLARMLRDVAWGQARRVTNAEVFAEFSHEDLAGGCTGFTGQICQFLDGIHPTDGGYHVIREKLWESLDGVLLGPRDALGATSIAGVDQGYLRRVARLFPRAAEARNGALLTDGAAAFSLDDGGAAASIRLGIGSEEVRFSGFPDWLDEIEPVRVIAGVRYRTSGTVTDDFYRVEASVDGTFRPPPGHAYSPTSWDFFTPIVGGGGPNAPAEDPDFPDAKLLVVPNVGSYRTVSATLTKNPIIAPDGTHYEWPAITLGELGTTEIRVAAAPVASSPGDDYEVLVDAVWLDVYGTAKPRPEEITGLVVERDAPTGDLVLTFDELTGAELYNVYFGALAPLHDEGRYTHGRVPDGEARCDVPTSPAEPGRRRTNVPGSEVPAGSRYLLVTGRRDGVESPAGYASDGTERDRSLNVCP